MPRNTTSKNAKESKKSSNSKKGKKKSKVAKTVEYKEAKTKKTKKPKAVKVDEPVVDDVEDETKEVVEEVVEEVVVKVRKKRSVPTRDTVLAELDAIIVSIDEEILHIRGSSTKVTGVKFLRSVRKQVKSVRNKSARVMKQKNKTARKVNTNSGFLKPVRISGEMAEFTGWDPEELKSRVDVTKYICKYIKDNDLQNPKDRRQILADAELSELLGFDSKKEKDPLTYYRIQTFMKKHFIKEEKKA